jgi:hypothetical protein
MLKDLNTDQARLLLFLLKRHERSAMPCLATGLTGI